VRTLNRILHLFKRRRFERDLQEELRIHREMAEENELRLGASKDEARYNASRSIGSTFLALEDSCSVWSFVWLESLVCDLRYTLRCLSRAPLFAGTVILTISLALGLNTMLFTCFNAYVLSPFAVQDPYSLYAFWWNTKTTSGRGFSWSEFQQLRQNNAAFSDLVATLHCGARVNGETFTGQLVSGNYFAMLGVTPAFGRSIIPSDATTPGTNAVIVLSYTAWRAKFAGDPGVIGRTVSLGGHPFDIVGIARRGFSGITKSPPDFWAPMTIYGQLVDGPDLFGPGNPHPLEVAGRLLPGVSPEEARASLLASAKQLTADRPEPDRVMSVGLESGATSFPLTAETIESFIPAFVAFALVLLLACANVANMMLARAMGRQREISVRLSLGAAGPRLIRQLLTEGFVLAMPAAVLGFYIARLGVQFGLRTFLAILPSEFAGKIRIVPINLDWRVFSFVLAAACVSTFSFALAPALPVTRADLISATRDDFSNRLRGGRLRHFLVVTQVVVCVLLLISTGLLLRAGRQAEAVDVGLNVHNVIEIDARENARDKIATLLASDRSIESVATAWRAPLNSSLRGIGVAAGDTRNFVFAGFNFVSPEYFGVFRVPLVRGRNFTPEEGRDEAPVVIVSETTAHKFWPTTEAIGQTLRIQPPPSDRYDAPDKYPQHTAVRVIGIALDVVSYSVVFGPDPTCIYFPTNAAAPLNRWFLVRVHGNREVVRRSLDSKLSAAVPGAIDGIIPMEQVLDIQYFPFRVFSWILEAIGGLALILTAAGIYGVISYLVALRSKEIGIRMAMGAEPPGVVRMVLSESVKLALAGMVIGSCIALAVGRVLAAHVFLVKAFNLSAYALSSAIVLAMATIAACIPARRASLVSPASVLRHD
jgi:predicted permease